VQNAGHVTKKSIFAPNFKRKTDFTLLRRIDKYYRFLIGVVGAIVDAIKL